MNRCNKIGFWDSGSINFQIISTYSGLHFKSENREKENRTLTQVIQCSTLSLSQSEDTFESKNGVISEWEAILLIIPTNHFQRQRKNSNTERSVLLRFSHQQSHCRRLTNNNVTRVTRSRIPIQFDLPEELENYYEAIFYDKDDQA